METQARLALLHDSTFTPVPPRRDHYVPALFTKSGELDALANLASATWERITPLIVILGPRERTEPFNRSTVRDWVKRISDVLRGHPCFLDIERLRPDQPAASKAKRSTVLEWIYEQGRMRCLNFVPTIRVGAAQTHATLVRDAAAYDGRGVAVRYSVAGMALASGRSHHDLLTESLEAIEQAPPRSDLILDFGFLQPDSEFEVDEVAKLVSECRAVGAWRSVILLATSIPGTMREVDEGTVGAIDRQEWPLWNSLPDDLSVTFGDYGIQHPIPPKETGPGMRANIRYTTEDATLVARGVGFVAQEGIGQYATLCEWLVERQEFCGRDFSWGDRLIYDCAKGYESPGAQPMWRGAGTSHHLQKVTTQLIQRAQRLQSDA